MTEVLAVAALVAVMLMAVALLIIERKTMTTLADVKAKLTTLKTAVDALIAAPGSAAGGATPADLTDIGTQLDDLTATVKAATAPPPVTP